MCLHECVCLYTFVCVFACAFTCVCVFDSVCLWVCVHGWWQWGAQVLAMRSCVCTDDGLHINGFEFFSYLLALWIKVSEKFTKSADSSSLICCVYEDLVKNIVHSLFFACRCDTEFEIYSTHSVLCFQVQYWAWGCRDGGDDCPWHLLQLAFR